MRGDSASRADLFATLDRPALSPLPDEPYVFARWSRPRVAPDYHVEIEGFFYSVPFGLIRETVDARATERTVEIFHHSRRVASHARGVGRRRGHVTDPAHMAQARTAATPSGPCALGHKACRDGRSVLYHRIPRLFEALALARGDGRYARTPKTPAPPRPSPAPSC